MAEKNKLTPAQCNIVQSEQIWKDHVYHEVKAVQKWNKTWGFMRQKYKNLNTEVLNKRSEYFGQSSYTKAKIDLPALTYQTHISRVPVIPLTSSANIGWRANNNLERFGHFARPCKSILRHLDWPIDAIG